MVVRSYAQLGRVQDCFLDHDPMCGVYMTSAYPKNSCRWGGAGIWSFIVLEL